MHAMINHGSDGDDMAIAPLSMWRGKTKISLGPFPALNGGDLNQAAQAERPGAHAHVTGYNNLITISLTVDNKIVISAQALQNVKPAISAFNTHQTRESLIADIARPLLPHVSELWCGNVLKVPVIGPQRLAGPTPFGMQTAL